MLPVAPCATGDAPLNALKPLGTPLSFNSIFIATLNIGLRVTHPKLYTVTVYKLFQECKPEINHLASNPGRRQSSPAAFLPGDSQQPRSFNQWKLIFRSPSLKGLLIAKPQGSQHKKTSPRAPARADRRRNLSRRRRGPGHGREESPEIGLALVFAAYCLGAAARGAQLWIP